MKRNVLLLIILGAFPVICFSQDAPDGRKKHFNTENGVAISGYDPVAYFKQGRPIRGSRELAVIYQGVTYYFSSPVNAGEFRRTPASYEPKYGGWCAYAMGKDGSKVEIDPETYKIVNGKLFVFYNKFLTNTLKSWNKDEVSLNRNADANWKKIYHE